MKTQLTRMHKFSRNTHHFKHGFLLGASVAAVAATIIAPWSIGEQTANAKFAVVWAWVDGNLGWSLPAFAAVLILFGFSLREQRAQLHNGEARPEHIIAREQWLDGLTALFFGIGVLWTAIGMRSALLSALGDLDATTAAQLGAFAILQRLVEGGILVALSTTIVGGVGGYAMRLIRTIVVSAQLQAYFEYRAEQEQREIYSRLERIENAVASHSTITRTKTDRNE